MGTFRHLQREPHSRPVVWPQPSLPGGFVFSLPSFQDVEVSPKVEAVLSLLNAPRLSLKLVRPKALLDNCFRVMELLYCPCCKAPPVGWEDVGVRRLSGCTWRRPWRRVSLGSRKLAHFRSPWLGARGRPEVMDVLRLSPTLWQVSGAPC